MSLHINKKTHPWSKKYLGVQNLDDVCVWDNLNSRDHHFEYHFQKCELCIADGFCIVIRYIIGHTIYILARIRTVGMSENPGGANICHVVLQINHPVKGWLLLIRHAGKNALTKLGSFK